MKHIKVSLFLLSLCLLTACTGNQESNKDIMTTNETHIETGIIAEQVLAGETGEIHYSYYLPKTYDENKQYPLMMIMPGYDMMWFGEDSSGSNISWNGFQAWTKLDEDMIVVSAQLTV